MTACFCPGYHPNRSTCCSTTARPKSRTPAHLWGKDAYETEDKLMAEYGKQSRVACIGPSGEKLSLIAAIMTDHGSAAGRSGLGAVMGSKKLKAVVARGNQAVPMADKETVDKVENGADQDLAGAGQAAACHSSSDGTSTAPAA